MRAADNESPPRLKKLSSGSQPSASRILIQISAIFCRSEGLSSSVGAPPSIDGSAADAIALNSALRVLRSGLPLALTGIVSTNQTRLGILDLERRVARNSRISA